MYFNDTLHKNIINALNRANPEDLHYLERVAPTINPDANYSGEHLSYYMAQKLPQKLDSFFNQSVTEKNYSSILAGLITGKQWDYLFKEVEKKGVDFFLNNKKLKIPNLGHATFLEFLARNINEQDIEKIRQQKWFNWRDHSNKGLLEYAVLEKNETLLKEILKNRSITSKHDKENTVLHLAVYQNDLDAVNLALKYGADINALNSMDSGETPLMLAIKKHHKRLKLSFASYKDLKDSDIERMAHRDTAISIIKVLLENKADINVKNSKGRDAFFYAIQGQDIVAIKLMLGKDVDLNMRKTGAMGHGNSILDLLNKKIDQQERNKALGDTNIGGLHQSLLEFKATLESMGIKKEINIGSGKRKILKL